MKAVLVMDMPSNCDMCELCDDSGISNYCGIPGIGKNVDDYTLVRPDWCPLKPIPEKANHPDWCDGGRYDKGYNACIDELLKGEEG